MLWGGKRLKPFLLRNIVPGLDCWQTCKDLWASTVGGGGGFSSHFSIDIAESRCSRKPVLRLCRVASSKDNAQNLLCRFAYIFDQDVCSSIGADAHQFCLLDFSL